MNLPFNYRRRGGSCLRGPCFSVTAHTRKTTGLSLSVDFALDGKQMEGDEVIRALFLQTLNKYNASPQEQNVVWGMAEAVFDALNSFLSSGELEKHLVPRGHRDGQGRLGTS